MKKNILIIIIAVAVMATLFIIGMNQNKTQEKEFYSPENEIENETQENENKNNITNNEEPETIKDLIQCLADEGVVIYASRTCPACSSLANSFGGYEKIKLIYVECNEKWERCSSEMRTNYVPEIQIKGELYNGERSPAGIAKAVNCQIQKIYDY